MKARANWWKINENHKRLLSSLDISLTLTGHDKSGAKFVKGSKGDIYTVTTASCTCSDFKYRINKDMKCKHMHFIGSPRGGKIDG